MGLFKTCEPDLTQWALRFAAGTESPEQSWAALETIFAAQLIEAGWDPASVKTTANSYARLWASMALDRLKEIHAPMQLSVLAKQAAAIAADIRKIQNLIQRKTRKRYAERVAKDIRAVGPKLFWPDAENAAQLFDRLRMGGKEAIPAAEIEAVAKTLDWWSSNSKEIAEAVATPIKRGRPRASRVFGLKVEILAQSYFRETGKLPRDQVYDPARRRHGEFFDLVERATIGSKRPATRKALAKAILRALDASPRVPWTLEDAATIAEKVRRMIERDQAEARAAMAGVKNQPH